MAKIYFFSAIFPGIAYCMKPTVINLINVLWKGEDMKYDLPMQSVFLYDTSKSPAYEFTNLLFFQATYVTCLSNVSVDDKFSEIVD